MEIFGGQSLQPAAEVGVRSGIGYYASWDDDDPDFVMAIAFTILKSL